MSSETPSAVLDESTEGSKEPSSPETTVHVRSERPSDYHCECSYCQKFIGELRRPDGSYYSRLERRAYYAKNEKHIAKTPLHIARWAVQEYSSPGDWVLDPTIGAGTTAVEALRAGRNVAGMEIEFMDTLRENVSLNNPHGREFHLRHGDARNIEGFLQDIEKKFRLVVNNPPYSGDTNQVSMGTDKSRDNVYDPRYANLAFLREGEEYWRTIRSIYQSCVDYMLPGGYFVVGVKDMMRQKKPFLLHAMLADTLSDMGLTHEGTAVLKHHPTTLFLNTYEKRFGIRPPLYQSIIVFSKK